VRTVQAWDFKLCRQYMITDMRASRRNHSGIAPWFGQRDYSGFQKKIPVKVSWSSPVLRTRNRTQSGMVRYIPSPWQQMSVSLNLFGWSSWCWQEKLILHEYCYTSWRKTVISVHSIDSHHARNVLIWVTQVGFYFRSVTRQQQLKESSKLRSWKRH